MPKLTVVLIRHGEDLHDVQPPPNKALAPLHQFYQPTLGVLTEIMKHLDPPCTNRGYQQAEEALRHLADAFRSTSDTRKLALYAAPYQRCVQSALMIAQAGFEPEDWSVWGLTTPDTQSAPTAIPIVVCNGLADCTTEIFQLGGIQPVTDAGLLLCAACPWNKAYKKDPLLGVLQQSKDANLERVQDWKKQTNQLVADVQYLRFLDEHHDPYSLTPMSPKCNVVTELIRPNKYLQPPRKGCYESAPQPEPELTGQVTLDACVQQARKAGCDTVLVVANPELIMEVGQRAGVDWPDPGPGGIATLYAKPSSSSKGSCTWTAHGLYPLGTRPKLPTFPGPITASVPPSPSFAKAMAEAGEERWGKFPPPPPECLPPNYPQDIPAFGTCLEQPEPTNKSWAWTSQPPVF